jgi:hypothetical protein
MKSNFKPILMSTPMVQAILEGRKTQTRRIIKIDEGEKIEFDNYETRKCFIIVGKDFVKPLKCKYRVGDILWVRETWAKTGDNFHDDWEREGIYYFKAENPFNEKELHENYPHVKGFPKWRPSIFMPKEASRIFLKLKSIRVEKLNNISGEDAMKEGVEVESMWPLYIGDFYRSYSKLWDEINGNGSWDKNPWVWVYEFERTETSFACS